MVCPFVCLVLAEISRLGRESDRSGVLRWVTTGYAQAMKIAETYDLLGHIFDDDHFIWASQAIFAAADNQPAGQGGPFVAKALYRILPLASQRRSGVYLQVIGEALPAVTAHLPRQQARLVLDFLAEQWLDRAGPTTAPAPSAPNSD